MDVERFPKLIKTIYSVVNELEEMFARDGKKRHFTPDGHMVGSIGEVLAAYHYGIELFDASYEKHDGTVSGRDVQIKATQRSTVAISSAPDYLLVLKISQEGVAEEVYSGPGNLVWNLVREKPRPKNGQYQIRLSRLKTLMESVAPSDRLERLKP